MRILLKKKKCETQTIPMESNPWPRNMDKPLSLSLSTPFPLIQFIEKRADVLCEGSKRQGDGGPRRYYRF